MSKKYKLFGWVGILITLMAALYFGVIADEPITATLSATSVSENMDSGTLVGTLAISCSGTPTAVYLTSGDDSFSLSPTADSKIYNLVTDKAFNYETDDKSYALKVSITDGSNRTEEKDISVSITNVDEVAPVASGSSETTNEDTTLSATVTATDSDSMQAMTYAVGTTKVQNGTLVFNADGSYTYAPDANFSGNDSFTFTAYDGFFTSNEATVDITVAAVNDAPTNDKAPTFSGTMHAGNTLAASSGTWNDTADGGTSSLTYSYQWQSSSTDGGTPTDIIGATTENYTLTKADSGKYIRIKQSCSDGTDTAAAYSAWQEVLNNAPVISTTKPVSMTFTEDGAAQELTFSATDADNDALTWSIKTNGKLGNATISDSKVTYTPTANANGSDSFVVDVSDGMDEDNITVNITITAENDLPVNTKAPSVSGSFTTGGVLTADQGEWNDTADGAGALSYACQWQTAPSNTPADVDVANISGETSATYTVKSADKGKYIRFKVGCSDGEGTTTVYSDWYLVQNTSPIITEGETASMSFLEDGAAKDITFSATDADTDALIWSVKTNGSLGIATISDSKVTYTPNANANGNDNFVVEVSDGTSSDSITVNVTITAVNDAPSFTKGADQAVSEDCGAQTVNAWASSISRGADNESVQTLSFTVTNNNNALFSGQPTVSATGVLTYTPTTNANGSATVSVSLADNGGTENSGADTSAVQTFTITVNAVNDTPTFTKGADQTVTEDCGAKSVSAWAKDIVVGPANESTQTYSFIVTSNNDALFSALPAIDTDGNLAYTPAANANGSATVTVSLKDSGGGADTSAATTFTISVTAENDTPTLTGDTSITTDEDVAYTYIFTIGDVEDAAGSLAISWDTSDTSLLTKAKMILGGSGANRTLTLTPVADRSGSLSFTITVKDSGGLSVTKTVDFTINAVNDAPVISSIADRTINEDTSSGAIGFAISDADSALDSCVVTVNSSNQSVVEDTSITLGGSGANRTITLSPVANSSGDTTIIVTVDDKSGAPNAVSTASFNVKVNAVNDSPTIDNIADVTIDEEGTTGDILFHFSDVDDANLTVSASTDNTAMIPKANIVLTKVTDTSYNIKVTPVTNKFGKATITVTVKDPSGLMATDSFDVTVNSVNDLPTLSAIAGQSTNEDSAKTVSLTISDVETAVGSLAMSAVSSSNTNLIKTANITFSSSGTTRTMTLTPIADAHGESTITVRVTDGDGGIAERTFKLTVDSVNDAPVFTKGADKTETEDCGAKSYSGWATGISAGPADEVSEGQTVAFTVTNDNNALFSVQPAISADGTLSFTPADNANGSAAVTVTLKDSGNASSAAQSFKITITAVNDTPVAKDMTKTLDTDENQSYRGYIVGTDVDKDALTYSITSNPTHGTVTIINDKTGAFEYVPTAYFYGDDSFKFKVNDGTVDSGEATVTMKIIGVNDPPVATGFSLSTNEDAAVTFDLDDHATDIDSVSLSYTVGTPDHGMITSLGNGQFSYTPNGNYFGSDYFTFTASDGSLSSNTAMVYVTVTQVNDAPTAIDEAISLSENQTLNGALKASDLEMNTLTYSIVTYPDETTVGKLTLVDVDKGTYTFVPVKNFRGTATFTYKAAEKSTSEKYETGAGTVTITMKPINNAPEVTGTPPLTLVTDEDTAKSGNVTASDPDTGDSLTYSVVSYPNHGSLNATTPIDPLSGAYVYTPESNYYGTDFFTAKAVDAGGLHTSIVLVKITVNPVNDPCTAYNQTIETAYNTSVSGYLAGYDSDGDPLTYSLVDGSVRNGTAILNNASTGSFTFTPTTNFSGNASFQYQVSDGTVTATATVYVYVWGSGGGGSGYTLTGITDRETPEDTPITVTITATGLASLASMTAASSNTTLLDDSGIVVTPKDGGSFDLTMTPKKDQTGRTVISLTFTYDTNKTLTRTFVLTVTPVNDDPTKNDKTITIDENKYVYDFVVAADVDDRSLTYTYTEPTHGTLNFNADGSFKYEPTTNWYGTDSFTFTVKDAANKTASGTITINVVQIYRSPMANSASFETDEDTVYTADTDSKKLTAVDYNSESLKYVIVSNGSLGTAALDEDTGKFTYTPKTNLSGSDSFTFKVIGQTSGLESGVARVAVTVNPVNDAPVANVKNIETNEDQVVSGRLQASDVEGNTLSFVLTSAGTVTSSGEEYTTATAFGTIKLNKTTGEYTYTPSKDKNGADTFTFKVADSGGAESAEYTVNITVAPINDAPAATNGAIEVDEDSSKTGSLSTFYSDLDTGDTHTFSLSQSPAKGTVVFNADGTYTYTPTANINGIDYFSFKVTDNGGLNSNVAQITVTIKPINDAPTMTAAATWTINEDSSANKFSFTVSDIEDAVGNLTVTGAATEAGKISAVSFSNSNGNCVMTVTPVAHFIGTATIRITVTDSGKDGTLSPLDPKSVSQDVAVTVAAVNDLPTIGSFSKNAVITDEDVTTEAVTFSIADEESPVSGLTVTGSSNNAALIKTVNITKGNDGNCSVTVTPQDNQYGTATVTVTVKDESNATRSANIAVTVNPVNDAPVVTPPTDQTINEDTGTEVLYYSISDIDSNVENIEMTALSSDNSKISGITLGGNGAERTVKVIPAKDATGDVTITLTADDKATVNNIGTGTFVIHLTPVNDAPTINAIADQITDEDVDKNGVLVSVGDIDSDVSTLTLSGVSGNTSLIKSSDITFTTDSDGKRYINMKPIANANGTALITVTVSDGTKTSSTSFKLTVNPINDAPEISAIADQTILEGAATGIITFNVSDIDNDVTKLTIAKTSGDETVIPLTGITVSGTGGERTVKVTPLADQNGKIKVTLTVSDEGGLTDSSEFYVDITPVNDAPSFTSGGNPAAVNEDCGAVSVPWATAISKGPANESGQALTFVVSSISNSALFSAQPAIAADGTLTFTPAANANGTSDVTVYLQDDGGTTNGGVNKTSSVTFTITVNPVNDKPTFTAPSTVTVNEDSAAYNTAWTTAMDKGATNESAQSYSNFTLTYKSGTTGLFSAGPAVDTSGKLSFTPASNANGSAVYTVTLKDNGGTTNGGVDTSDTFDLTITVNPVNDAPSFTKGSNQTVLEDSAAAVVTGWATNTKTGPDNESAQTLTGFTVTNNNNSLFSAQPALATDGKLTFTPAANANGSATVTVTLKDDGGTANGGINTSAAQTFTITVTAVNDAPSFTKGADISVNEDSGAYSNASAWATGLSKGASNESGQTLAFTATNNNNALFSVQPVIDANGKLTFTPAANAYGEANVTVTLKDNGGTANGGVDTSAAQTFKISVNPVNDAPSFTKGADQTVLEDSTTAVVTGWATNIKTGPDNESAQTLDVFVVNNSNNTLFSVQPALSTDGKLTFTPAANANGSATVTVTLKDDGGTANGGIETSTAQTFTITVTAVNDAPSFNKISEDPVTVEEDRTSYSAAWVSSMNMGPANESSQSCSKFTVTYKSGDTGLFSSGPAIDTNGKLSFTPTSNANGSAVYTVTMTDSGGTANGGIDTSDAVDLTITVNPVNDAPLFIMGTTTTTVLEDCGEQIVADWVTKTSIKTGPDNENAQTLVGFTVTNNNSALFASGKEPAIDVDGTLTYTPADNANGTATVTVKLKDNGGTANGGIDTSAAQTFTITVTAVNDKPIFTNGADVSVGEDSVAYNEAWASSMNMGPANESSQSCSMFTVTYKSGDTGLFSSGPAIDTNGKLSFTPASNANGSAVYTVTMTDSGGTANGGIDTSDAFDLTITVNPVNDAPLFTMGTTTTTVLEDCGEQIVAEWVTKTSIKPGPDNENAQTLDNFVVTNSNDALFSVQPAIDADGKLTFTPAANANGMATVTVALKDNGGVADGGIDSTTKTFDINVTAVNDAPSFTKGADVTVGVGTGAKTYNGWATGLSKGPDNESAQTLSFTLTSDKDEIFDVLPAIDSCGNLSFTPSATKNGTATVTVTMKDNGGTANGGVENATATFTIRVLSASELKLMGTIYDAKTNAVIVDATVNLLNMDGTLKSTVKTGADGSYAFDKLAVSKYIIEVIKAGYNDNSRITNVAFDAGVAGVVTEDFYMADFKLVLTADPQKILGDGASKTMLTATVTDSDGKPISGIKLVFLSEKTTFSAEKTTDVNGQAQVEFSSDKLSGIDQLLIPIMVTVNDPVRKLYGSDWIYEYFVPGFVEGVVRDGNTNKPIKGATVTVYKDFDGDGTIDFSETVVTGDDGVYKIAVPKGKVDYDIKITKPVTIGDKTENITVDQAVSVGDITGSGTPSETYAPVISASGIAILANEDGSSSIVKDFSAASKISMEIVDSVGVSHALTPDSSGVFKATGLTTGATYTIDAIYTFDDGSKIVVGSSTITISATGEMNISQVLIDPYGTITDSASGKVIDGANVKLYYAKTAANIAAGKTPDTLVALPTVASFPPANNANPQSSDSSGLYAFMVFPNTDYYIVAEKPGYATYTSPTIPVGLAIVNWDFKMTPVMYDDSSKAENDLAIEISSDKMKVEEGSSTSLTATYKNKSADTISDYTITVTIPDGMTVADAAGGNVSGNTITWIGKDLAAGEIKSLKIVLTAPQLSKKEQSVTVKAEITSTVKLSNTEDDTSSITFILYSNSFDGSHKRYIRGYPDSTFGPSRNLTRAETAAIFARLLDLDVSSTATSYSDVDPALWSAGYIAAVSNYGLMKGYVDGSFLPENPITRAEFATIAARYFQIERSNSVVAIEEHFSDTGDSWAKSTIDEVYRCGIINGYSDGTFKPNNSISRAEAVTMLNRMLYRGPVSTDKNLFTDISSSDWFYGQVMEASMSHSYMINSDATEAVTSWIEDEMK